ncbi:coiled-coil domain-containing protein 189-like [Belonocnema kinseyi]|uniref:coiled-coil domain-containing protein 189-like n=1 Tax=Belonocnema kinseyi TaxID=2817044 RepID=UPI00143E0218|nr:coiled-coil domain-containing protein 189-like [Belonocnema kinseyi]
MSETLCGCGERKKYDSEPIEEVHRVFLSDTVISDRILPPKTSSSEPDFHYVADYDELCGPWIFPKNPAIQIYDEVLAPKLCTWEFLSREDMKFLQQNQQEKEAILSLIGNKLPENLLFGGKNRHIFLHLVWEVFQFVRDNGFTEKGISVFLGLFYKTHRFFLSHARRTIEETYKFFYDGILLHSVLHPPDKDEVLTPSECKLLLDLFHSTYMQQMMLIRFVCLPNYNLVLKLKNSQEEQ